MKSAALIICLFLSLCFNPASSNDIKSTIDYKNEEIKRSIEKARSDNALWRDTLKLHQTAQRLILEKHYTQANKILDDVLHQLQAAHQQAIQQNSQLVIPEYLQN